MKITRSLVLSLTAMLLPLGAVSQEVCPCIPIAHQWIVEPCATWNCAASATVMANGDKFVMTVPTNDDQFKWIIVRRVVSGSYIAPPDAPFQMESFDDGPAAMLRFSGLDHQLQPIILSAVDGKFLIVTRSPVTALKQRSVGH